MDRERGNYLDDAKHIENRATDVISTSVAQAALMDTPRILISL
jgi:hypothetical protein